ncbi:MAG: hypothetical protein K2K57_04445, partial [Oscillospiraceae bacterium]|nr:hypothetical protein [Oscillospiraceae bacterium]
VTLTFFDDPAEAEIDPTMSRATLFMSDYLVDLEMRAVVDENSYGLYGPYYGYFGTLSVTSYDPADVSRRNPIDSVNIYENETFGLEKYADRESFMEEMNSVFFTVTVDYPEGRTWLYDIDDSGKISPYEYEGGYEIPTEMLKFAGYSDGKVHHFWDYGDEYYTEYTADKDEKVLRRKGAISFRPDLDMTYPVMRSESLIKTYWGGMADCFFRHYLTEESRKDEITYYRVSPEFASSEEEFRDIIAAAFTDDFIEQNLINDPFVPSRDDTPAIFSEDDEGLVYADFYRGEPPLYDYDTVRLITDNSYGKAAMVLGTSVEGYYILMVYFNESADDYSVKDCDEFRAGMVFMSE